MGPLTKDLMLSTLSTLNQKLEHSHPDLKISLVLGGGGAMILAHGFPRGTTDIDAIPRGVDPEVLAPLVRAMSVEFNLPANWTNQLLARKIPGLEKGDRFPAGAYG
jgi:hypothetical protein